MILSPNDINHIYDCIFLISKEKYTEDRILELFDQFPKSLKNEIEEWGANDTLIREKIIEYLKENEFNTKFKMEK